MGFYIRKSVSVGPFRFNLSNSGIGYSVGVKGLRVGSGPHGAYVHMGRGGIYYKAQLGTRGGHRRVPVEAQRPQPIVPVQNDRGIYHTEVIEAGDLPEMSPSSVSEIVDKINEKAATIALWPLALVSGLLIALWCLAELPTPGIGGIVLVITVVAAILLHRLDASRRAVVIMYDLDDGAIEKFKSFVERFDDLSQSSVIWNVETSSLTTDWKRNAGATNLIKRVRAMTNYAAPRVVKTNIDVPSIVGGKRSLHFFPDVLLVQQGKRYGAVPYGDFTMSWNAIHFRELETVPRDTEVVGDSWRYTNKNGTPDRRFKNNRQIPIARYHEMSLTGPGGLQKILHFSKVQDRAPLIAAMKALTSFRPTGAMETEKRLPSRT